MVGAYNEEKICLPTLYTFTSSLSQSLPGLSIPKYEFHSFVIANQPTANQPTNQQIIFLGSWLESWPPRLAMSGPLEIDLRAVPNLPG